MEVGKAQASADDDAIANVLKTGDRKLTLALIGGALMEDDLIGLVPRAGNAEMVVRGSNLHSSESWLMFVLKKVF